MTFIEFLNQKNKSRLMADHPFKVEPAKEPSPFAPVKPSMTPVRRSIKPFIDGLAGQSFRNRTIPKKPTDFLPRATNPKI